MLQQVIPQGPAKAAEETIDRTSVLDPAELWPDPLACPDWPAVSAENARHTNIIRGRAAAEERLEALGRRLNRAGGRLRAPTKDEREKLFAAIFRRSGSGWHSLGLNDLGPSGPLYQHEAELIVEAAHLRGYLRKLDALDAKRAEGEKHEDARRARRAIDGFAAALASGKEELGSIAEAVARHEQRIADELAFRRRHEIREALRAGHFEASQAARKLGIEAPDAPQLD